MVEKMNAQETEAFFETDAFHAKEMYKRYNNPARIND